MGISALWRPRRSYRAWPRASFWIEVDFRCQVDNYDHHAARLLTWVPQPDVLDHEDRKLLGLVRE